ncbi:MULTISPECIES: DUF6889 family protein [Serratia]
MMNDYLDVEEENQRRIEKWSRDNER